MSEVGVGINSTTTMLVEHRPLGNDQAPALQFSQGQHEPCGAHLPSEHAVLAGAVEPVRVRIADPR